MANNKSMPVLPDDSAPLAEKVNWLLMTHGFCERLDRVVKLYEPSDQCLLTRPAFTFSRKPWYEVITGPTRRIEDHAGAGIWMRRRTGSTSRASGCGRTRTIRPTRTAARRSRTLICGRCIPVRAISSRASIS